MAGTEAAEKFVLLLMACASQLIAFSALFGYNLGVHLEAFIY